jgi:CheY-like chemotaxis protein
MKLKKKSTTASGTFWTTKIKILVAEDDSISLKFISKILKIFGDNLLIARNGFEAVNLCKK